MEVTQKSWWRKIWDNNVAREIILFVVSVFAVQFAFSANDLLGIVQTSKDFEDIWTGISSWGNSFMFAALQTGIKQGVAGGLSWAAGRKLAGPNSN